MSQMIAAGAQVQAQTSKTSAGEVRRSSCDKCRKKKPILQRSPEALDTARLAFMEPRFSYDFSQIPVHSRPQASIQAKFKVNQQSITDKPTDSSANVLCASTEIGTNDENAFLIPTIPSTVKRDANSPDEDGTGSSSRKAAKCSDEVSFSLQKLASRLEQDERAVQMNADGKLIIPNIVFQLNAAVRADKNKRIKDSQVRQWKLGIIQNVRRSRAQLDYSDPQNRDDIIDCGVSDQKETHIDCDNGKPWYNPAKRAFVRFPRFIHMSDRPQLEEVDLVNARRSVLRRVQRDFKASTFVVAEKNNSFCVLSRVDWGFSQNDLFTPNVAVTHSGVIPAGVGKIEKNLQIDKPSEHGPDSSGVPLTSGECKPQPPFGECPDDTTGPQPTSQTSQSNQRPQVATRTGLAARVERRTAYPRFEENHIQRPNVDISSTTQMLHRKAVRGSDATGLLDGDSGANESGVSSRSILEEQIQNFQNTCTGIAGVKCVNGEIVENLPKCIEEAPCGIAECVKQHELSHATEITRLFQSRLGRHPCKHQDGTPFADGFEGFGEDFVGEAGEGRTWKTFLLRSERKAYGIEVRCLREMRRNSKDRICKRALALEGAKSAFRRFLAAIGINPGI